MPFLVSFLCALCVLCGESAAQDFKTIHDGVEYATVNYKLGSDPVKVNLLRLDLRKVRLDVHHAMDAAIGTEKTSSIATRHGAVAAINAGFFRLDASIWAGDSQGVLSINYRILSENIENRIALFIRNFEAESQVSFAYIDVGDFFELGRSKLYFTGINRERKASDLVEYTKEFGRTTLTNSDGIEVVVSNGRIIAINDLKGSSEIPFGGFVISASGDYAKQLRPLARLGAKVKPSAYVRHRGDSGFPSESNRTSRAFSGAEDITNGRPQLIRSGKIDITWEKEKVSKDFVETRHPRTAVAKLKDGKFLMITVDGRQPGVSVGMNLYELADYLLSIGAQDAMNLDGGGSTTMFLDGKVVNTPSDKEGERKVGDAILVTLRKKQ